MFYWLCYIDKHTNVYRTFDDDYEDMYRVVCVSEDLDRIIMYNPKEHTPFHHFYHISRICNFPTLLMGYFEGKITYYLVFTDNRGYSHTITVCDSFLEVIKELGIGQYLDKSVQIIDMREVFCRLRNVRCLKRKLLGLSYLSKIEKVSIDYRGGVTVPFLEIEMFHSDLEGLESILREVYDVRSIEKQIEKYRIYFKCKRVGNLQALVNIMLEQKLLCLELINKL